MKKFHIMSILLGMGIGLVITSIISMIYLAGSNPSANITNVEIIERAKKLGMVENTELFKHKDQSIEAKSTSSEVKTSKPSESISTGSVQADKTKVDDNLDIKIVVSAGDSSEVVADKLLKAGLIADKQAFIKELSSMGLASSIDIGEYKIKKGIDTKGIIKMISKSK